MTFVGIRFPHDLDMRLVVSGKQRGEWILTKPFSVMWRGGQVIAEAHFVTDGPSVPKVARSIISLKNAWRASVIHDWLYVMEPSTWTRKKADKLFYDCLRADGVGWLRAQAMYRAVRVGGGHLWAKAKSRSCSPSPRNRTCQP